MLDAALALEPHVDVNRELHRSLYPEFVRRAKAGREKSASADRFRNLPGEADAADAARAAATRRSRRTPSPTCCGSSRNYAPELEDWERDIFLAVRAESFYFYPVFACNIMNEGWATYWHARLLREADFLPQETYLDGVTRALERGAAVRLGQQAALAINPYHLGFTMWERIVEQHGLDAREVIRRDEDDFGFIRNYLDRELAEKLGLFVFEAKSDDEISVASRDVNKVREAILAPKFNYGAPRIAAAR